MTARQSSLYSIKMTSRTEEVPRFHEPQLGDDALHVVQYICAQNGVQFVNLVKHSVGVNWRQRISDEDKPNNIDLECFRHNGSYGELMHEETVACSGLYKLCEADLEAKCEKDEVYSICSDVKDESDSKKHLTMMNFHPERGGLEFVLDALKALRQQEPELVSPGVVLASGRYWHYYGYGLIEEPEMGKYLSYFLMPAILVSPRYIGHRLYEGRGMLRLTGGATAKPGVPKVVTAVR